MVGTLVGAALNPAPAARFTAESIIASGAGIGGGAHTSAEARSELRRARGVLDLPILTEAVRGTSSATNFRERVDAEEDRDSGLIRVSTRAVDPKTARELADTVAQQALRLVYALDGGAVPLGDFEGGMDQWGISAPRFAVRPEAQVAREIPPAKYHDGILAVDCGAEPGCGPSLRIFYPFLSGQTYRATAWARSDSTTSPPLSLALGSDSNDVEVSKAKRPRVAPPLPAPTDADDRPAEQAPRKPGPWTRYTVEWTPSADHGSADLALMHQEKGRTSFSLDGVSLLDAALTPFGARTRTGDKSLFDQRRALTALPAQATGTVDGSTVVWVLVGAGLGLLVAGGGLGAARLAARKR